MLSIRNGVISTALAAAIACTSFTPASASPRGDRLMLGAVAGVFGTIAALAARSQYDGYYDGPVYYGEPVYGGPVYGGPAYVGRGPRFAFNHGGYGGHAWHGRHGHR